MFQDNSSYRIRSFPVHAGPPGGISRSCPRSGRNRLLLAPLLACVCLALQILTPPAAASEVVLYSEDFEASNGVYTHVGAIDEWEWGMPVFGVGVTPHSGSRVWGTDLDGRLNFYHDGRLRSPQITLPAVSPTERIYVSYYALIKLDSMSDRGTFYVSSDQTNWLELSDSYYTMEMGVDASGEPLETGATNWKKYVYDVTSFAGGPLYLQFECKEPEGGDYWYGSPPHDMAGWYIDDVSVVKIDGVAHQVQMALEGYEDPSATASCPWLVYTQADTTVKENDVYSVARSPAAEFTDYLPLENGAPQAVNGVYTFKLMELEEEHSYTDRLALMVVDHAEGVEVGCDPFGQVYTYSDPVVPRTAVDGTGADVSADVNEPDGTGVPLFHGEHVEMDFGNVPPSPQARLICRVKGFLRDYERDPGEFRDQPSPAVVVQTRDVNGEWVDRVSANPRFNWSTMTFDVSNLLPDGLGERKVRLLARSCRQEKYHILDWVGLDVSAPAPANVVQFHPITAVHSVQGNVGAELMAEDGNRVVMSPGELITLTFPAPDPNGLKRDLFFVSHGYYIQDPNTYYVFTWDGSDWVLRDGFSYTTPVGTDMTHTFDLSLFLPDPAGEYKVRIWQDYRYEPAAIDYTGLTVDGAAEPLLSATNLEWNPLIVDCANQLRNSDDQRLEFQSYRMRGRTRIVEVKWQGPACASVPQAQDLDVGGLEDIYNIVDPTPAISWNYFDALGHAQTEYAVQVWTQAGGAGTNLWNLSAAGEATSAEYAGEPLVPGNSYYARVRVRDSEGASCWSAWNEVMFRMYCADCEPPVIVRTPETIALGETPQASGQDLQIAARITDNVGVEGANLFYRRTGTADYISIPMTPLEGNLYRAVIPGTAVQTPGVDYYLWATDGSSSATSPATNPASDPHQIAVIPNEPPVITHTPVTAAPCGNVITITAGVHDVTDYVAAVRLHYRIGGEFLYTIHDMSNVGGENYQDQIPAAITLGATVEYFISAADNHGTTSNSGSFDEPHVVTLNGSCDTAPSVSELTVSPGTPCRVTDFRPTFGWTYSDSEGQPQSAYEVEVWSGPGRTGARLWNPAVGSGAANNVTYDGAALQEGSCYYFSIRAYDGWMWSVWSELRFCYDALALAPTDATLGVGESAVFTAVDGVAPFIWTLLETSICTAEPLADNVMRVTALAPGTATLRVQDSCLFEASAIITVTGGSSPLGLALDDGIADSLCAPAGSELLFTLTFDNRNNPGFPALNSVLTDSLPPQLLVEAVSDSGMFNPAERTVSWSLGEIAAGAPPRNVTFSARIDPGAAPGVPFSNLAILRGEVGGVQLTSQAAHQTMVCSNTCVVVEAAAPILDGGLYRLPLETPDDLVGCPSTPSMDYYIDPAFLTVVDVTRDGSMTDGQGLFGWRQSRPG